MKIKEVDLEACTLPEQQIDESKGLIAYWKYLEDTKEFDCTKSFEIA